MKQVLRYRYVRRVSVPHKQARTCNEATSITNQGQKNQASASKACNAVGSSKHQQAGPVMKQQASPTKDKRTRHQQARTCNAVGSSKHQQALRYRFVRRVSVSHKQAPARHEPVMQQAPVTSTSKHFDTGSFVGYQYHTSRHFDTSTFVGYQYHTNKHQQGTNP